MKIKIGIIGLGTVGSGVIELLQKNAAFFSQELGFELEIAGACSRTENEFSNFNLPNAFKTTDPMALAQHTDIDILVEVAGGTEKPREWHIAALQSGKHIVTANKALLANHGTELFPLAAAKNCFLLFEAAVGGGIPIIKSLQESLLANDIQGLACIINGTCNYILTEMSQQKISFDTVLQHAQKLGYAEADPSFDIDGIDSAHKVALLASLCYGKAVDYKQMWVEGIRNISAMDMQMAQEMGFVIKLLGIISQNADGRIQASVYPSLLEKNHQLATVSGVLNAIYLKTSAVGPLLLTGAGAGKLATGSAVVSDIITIARQLATGKPKPLPMSYFNSKNPASLASINELETEFYIRLTTIDKPGVLAKVTSILGEAGISIRAIMQKPEHDPENVPVIFLTHTAKNSQIAAALAQINVLDIVKAPAQVLRFYK